MQLGQFSEVLNKQCQNKYINPSKYSPPCDIQILSLLVIFLNAINEGEEGRQPFPVSDILVQWPLCVTKHCHATT
jgi:hypothetical protein